MQPPRNVLPAMLGGQSAFFRGEMIVCAVIIKKAVLDNQDRLTICL